MKRYALFIFILYGVSSCSSVQTGGGYMVSKANGKTYYIPHREYCSQFLTFKNSDQIQCYYKGQRIGAKISPLSPHELAVKRQQDYQDDLEQARIQQMFNNLNHSLDQASRRVQDSTNNYLYRNQGGATVYYNKVGNTLMDVYVCLF